MNKKIDIMILGLMLLVGIFYGVLTKDLFLGKALITFSVFTIPPIIYLALRQQKDWQKILLSTAIFGILFAVMIDFFEEYSGGWDTISIVIPFKILGVDPLDNILAYMEMIALTIIFYQHFIDSQQITKVSKKIFLAILLSMSIIAVEVFLYFYFPTLLKVKYSYLYMGTLALVLPILVAFRKPSLIKNMLLTSLYFFILYFCIEIVALKNNFWIYPGSYIGWVSIFGVTFPFEELFFWMMGYAACIVAYYEVFIKEQIG